jgi:hypothetical protein
MSTTMSSLSLWERDRVREINMFGRFFCPLIRPSATFSLGEKGPAEELYSSGDV